MTPEVLTAPSKPLELAPPIVTVWSPLVIETWPICATPLLFRAVGSMWTTVPS